MPEVTLIPSIHDVMPGTLPRVERLARRIEAAGLAPALLLVVPDAGWNVTSLRRLRTLADSGHPLAGHGWRHRIIRFGSLRHRLHGAAFSRNVGEHLELDRNGVQRLVRRCRHWFDESGLPAPATYVPPAWAMGPVRPEDLEGLGFRYFEYLWGTYDCQHARRAHQPLIGFEADTRVRRVLLRASNRANLLLARRSLSLRLAIHPGDESLLLADDLAAWLAPGQHAG